MNVRVILVERIHCTMRRYIEIAFSKKAYKTSSSNSVTAGFRVSSSHLSLWRPHLSSPSIMIQTGRHVLCAVDPSCHRDPYVYSCSYGPQDECYYADEYCRKVPSIQMVVVPTSSIDTVTFGVAELLDIDVKPSTVPISRSALVIIVTASTSPFSEGC